MRKLEVLQILRAAAALLVVLCHGAAEVLKAPVSGYDRIFTFINLKGLFGVDVFFIISGFIMFYINRSDTSKRRDAATFLLDRAFRVVPLYWIAISLSIAVSTLIPSMKYHNSLDLVYIAKSFLFIPARNPVTGAPEPILGLGWTLNYEMFFYLIYAFILLKFVHRQLEAAALILGTFVAIGILLPLDFFTLRAWSHSIILEFLLGMAISKAFADGIRISGLQALASFAVGIVAWLAVGPEQPDFVWRGLIWGVPAALIVGSAVLYNWDVARKSGPIWRRFVKIGDASYSLYITHLFVMRVCSVAVVHLNTSRPVFALIFFALFIPSAVIVSFFSRRLIEIELTARLKKMTSPSVVV
jgi:exopolysaccharide production protein ExoZ